MKTKSHFNLREKDVVANALVQGGGSPRALAETLDVSLATAYRYIKEYKIEHLKKKPKWSTPKGIKEVKQHYKKCKGNMSQMAREMGISRQAISKRMNHPALVEIKEEGKYPKNELACKLVCSLKKDPEHFKSLYKKYCGNYTKIASAFGFEPNQLTPFTRQIKAHGLYKDYPPTRNRLGINRERFKKLYSLHKGDVDKLAEVLKATRPTVYTYIRTFIAKGDR